MEKEKYLEPDYEILLLEKADVIKVSETDWTELPDVPFESDSGVSKSVWEQGT